MMRRLLLLAAASTVCLIAEDCVKIDRQTLLPAKCGPSQTCTLSGNGDDLRAAVLPYYAVTGHNSCKAVSADTAIRVAFYDREGYRIGLDVLSIAPMKVGERFRAVREVPVYVRVAGPAWKIQASSK